MPHPLDTPELNARLNQMEHPYFLFGLISAFSNRMQAVGDRFFGVLSWRQSFMMVCIELLSEPPTIQALADVTGCSHQNAKQLLTKLEKAGYVTIAADAQDRRKQRVSLTQKARDFQARFDLPSQSFMSQLFEGVAPEDLDVTIRTIVTLEKKLKQMQGEQKL